MNRRDWWIGITVVACAVVVHAAIPRYEWRQVLGISFNRIDRWTGRLEEGRFEEDGWKSWTEIRAAKDEADRAVAAQQRRIDAERRAAEEHAIAQRDAAIADRKNDEDLSATLRTVAVMNEKTNQGLTLDFSCIAAAIRITTADQLPESCWFRTD